MCVYQNSYCVGPVGWLWDMLSDTNAPLTRGGGAFVARRACVKRCSPMERVIFTMAGWMPRRHRGRVTGKGVISGSLDFCLDKRLVVRYEPWTGWLLVAVERFRGGVEIVRDYPWFEVKEMKKRSMAQVAVTGPGGSLAAKASTVFGGFPHLLEQLTVVKLEDESPRTPGGLLISTQGSMWKLSVTEPDPCLKLTFLAQFLDDALAGLELALGSDSIPWEIDQWALSRRPKNKK